MGVKLNVYSKNRLNGKDSEGNIKTTLPALFLTAYKNATIFKRLFYCDDVWIQKDSENKQVINGLVEENGSNLSMRDVKRKGNLRIRKNSKNYVVLNDAGLNTYATVSAEVISTSANYITIDYTILSAFYSKTKDFGVYIDIKDGDSTILSGYKQSAMYYEIPAKAGMAVSSVIRNFEGMEKGRIAILTPYTTNDEGEKKYSSFSVRLTDKIVTLNVIKITDFYATPNEDDMFEVYMSAGDYTRMLNIVYTGVIGGIASLANIYSDIELTNRLEEGYYNLPLFAVENINYPSDSLGEYGKTREDKAILVISTRSTGNVGGWTKGQWIELIDYDVYVTYTVTTYYQAGERYLKDITIKVDKKTSGSISFACSVYDDITEIKNMLFAGVGYTVTNTFSLPAFTQASVIRVRVPSATTKWSVQDKLIIM